MPSPINIPKLKAPKNLPVQTGISVLISSKKDLNLCKDSSATVYFQLPNCFHDNGSEYIDLFTKNKNISDTTFKLVTFVLIK